jgi:hypothetical protein
MAKVPLLQALLIRLAQGDAQACIARRLVEDF